MKVSEFAVRRMQSGYTDQLDLEAVAKEGSFTQRLRLRHCVHKHMNVVDGQLARRWRLERGEQLSAAQRLREKNGELACILKLRDWLFLLHHGEEAVETFRVLGAR